MDSEKHRNSLFSEMIPKEGPHFDTKGFLFKTSASAEPPPKTEPITTKASDQKSKSDLKGDKKEAPSPSESKIKPTITTESKTPILPPYESKTVVYSKSSVFSPLDGSLQTPFSPFPPPSSSFPGRLPMPVFSDSEEQLLSLQNVKIFHKINEKWTQKANKASLFILKDMRNIYKIVVIEQDTLINLPVSEVDIKPYNESAVQWKTHEIHYGVRFSSMEDKNSFVSRYSLIKDIASPRKLVPTQSLFTEFKPPKQITDIEIVQPHVVPTVITSENEEDQRNIKEIIALIPKILKKSISFTENEAYLDRSLRTQTQKELTQKKL
jgi:hypothetical protein